MKVTPAHGSCLPSLFPVLDHVNKPWPHATVTAVMTQPCFPYHHGPHSETRSQNKHVLPEVVSICHSVTMTRKVNKVKASAHEWKFGKGKDEYEHHKSK